MTPVKLKARPQWEVTAKVEDKKTVQKIRAAITVFENAVMDMAFAGAAPPEDRLTIESEYEATREQLDRLIRQALIKKGR